MSNYTPLKLYFDTELARMLALKIRDTGAHFPVENYVREVASRVGDLELKQRIEVLADGLYCNLSGDYPEKIRVLTAILGPENPNETGMFTEGYWLMPVAFVAEKYGIDHFRVSTSFIGQVARRNTGEYAIRPYIEKYPQQTLRLMNRWSKSRNFHLRRLASEGLRPRLPWARKLDCFIDSPNEVFAILENLKSDDSRFVQKSVANHLKDMLRENYPATIRIVKKWSNSRSEQTQWIVRHAIKNEIKAQNPEALSILDRVTP